MADLPPQEYASLFIANCHNLLVAPTGHVPWCWKQVLIMQTISLVTGGKADGRIDWLGSFVFQLLQLLQTQPRRMPPKSYRFEIY
jgi:hypothetical protein